MIFGGRTDPNQGRDYSIAIILKVTYEEVNLVVLRPRWQPKLDIDLGASYHERPFLSDFGEHLATQVV